MRYSYTLFKFYDIAISIHIAYILMIIFAPLVFYFIFNLLIGLAILEFLILLTLSVILHELGRAYISRRYKIYLSEIILLPFGGISIRKKMPKSTFDELRIALYSLGVYFAIMLIMLPFMFSLYGFENILHTRLYDFSPAVKFFQINIALLLFNIIPIYPLDGGRILRSYLTHKYDFQKATKMVTVITYILGAILIVIGLVFGFVLIVLVLFIYAGAQGKSKFDRAAEVLHLGDKDMKARERARYEVSRTRVISRTKEIQLRAEEVLKSSRVGTIAKIWLKLRDTFKLKIRIGKFIQIRELLLSFLPLVLRIRQIIKLWLLTKPIRKSIFLMLLGTVCLTILWLLTPEYMLLSGLCFLLLFCTGIFIIYFHTRSRRLLYYTIIGSLAWILYLALDLFEPLLALDYFGYLYYEGFRGCLVPITGILFFAAIVNSNPFFKNARTSMPIPTIIITSTLYVVGVIVLFYEIYLLSAFETDLDTIRFTLRYDISYLIWFSASATIFGSLIYMMYVGSISRFGRITTVKVITASIIMILFLSFFSRDFFIIMLARFSTEPEDIKLKVGLHSRNITKLDPSEFDNFFHLEVTWASTYKDNAFEADWCDKDWQLAYADQNGIDIYLLINPRVPKWFILEHPDAVMRDQWNETFYWIDKDPREGGSSRIWDLSFNDPEVVNAKKNFTIESLSRYQNLSCVKYISIQNEPIYPVDFNHLRIASYDPVTEAAFQVWIAKYFDYDFDSLKNETGLELTNWLEIEAPRSAADKLWKYWLTFREDSLIEFVRKLTTAVRVNTTKPVTVKILGHYLSRYETIQTGLSKRVLKKFFDFSDVISLDLYPLTVSDLIHSLKFYKDLARGKQIIISEYNLALGSNLPGSGSMFYYTLIIINEYSDSVIVYTGEDHYIYGIYLYDHTPVHIGLKIFRIHRSDGDVLSLYYELLQENFYSVYNYYEIYLFSCAVWNLPVIPWPIMILILMPVPIADDKKRWRVKKIFYLIIIIIMLTFFIGSNLPT